MSLVIPVIAADGAKSTVTLPDPTVNSTTVTTINVGQTSLLPTEDDGNANLMIAMPVPLSVAGTVQSLSLYTPNVAGQLVMGVYDSTGASGAPGKLLTTTAAMTPVKGWNKVNVTPVALAAGNYWLVYLASSNSLQYQRSVNNTPMARYASHTFGALPTAFPTTSTQVDSWWSFYATLTTTATPPPPPPPTTGVVQVGLMSWDEIQSYSAQVKAMGLPVHRINMNGGLDDATFAACLAAGVTVMLVIYPNGSSDPTSATVLAEIDQQLTRYGPNGTYWHDNPLAPKIPVDSVEILNEPNWYLTGSLQQKAQEYAPILIAAYQHVKANFPTVKVVGCSVSDSNSAADQWLSILYSVNPQVFKSMDVFSYHPYTGGDTPPMSYPPDQTIYEDWGTWSVWSELADLRNAMTNQYGAPANLPFWITEVGFPISQASGGTYATASTDPNVTVAEQAAYNIRFDVFCARQGIARIFHMYIDDDDGFNGGYFKNPSTPRPVATATTHMQQLIKGATAFTVISENYSGPGPFVYKFTTPTGPVIVAWAQTPQVVPIAISGTTTVTDQLGNVITTTTATSYSASLSETPIWLQSK